MKYYNVKSHIDKLVTKMRAACYANRIVRGLMSQGTLKDDLQITMCILSWNTG
jgi:hypothetical protein